MTANSKQGASKFNVHVFMEIINFLKDNKFAGMCNISPVS